LSVGLGLTADLVWPVVLGAKWSAASELIRLCAFYALFDSIGHFTHGVFIVLNRQRRLVITYAPIVVLRFAVAIVAGLHWGIVAAVWTLTVTAALSTVIWIAAVLPILELHPAELVRPIWRTVTSSAAMAAVVLAWCPLESAGLPFHDVALRLVAASAVGAVVFISVQLLLWLAASCPDGPEHRALEFLTALRRRIGRAVPVPPGMSIR